MIIPTDWVKFVQYFITLEKCLLFVAVGQAPENEPFKDVMDLDDGGYAASGEDCRTRTDGIFVAGDCRQKSVRQLATAVSDGAAAATPACEYLDSLE